MSVPPKAVIPSGVKPKRHRFTASPSRGSCRWIWFAKANGDRMPRWRRRSREGAMFRIEMDMSRASGQYLYSTTFSSTK